MYTANLARVIFSPSAPSGGKSVLGKLNTLSLCSGSLKGLCHEMNIFLKAYNR
jgi:hypothetical protein